MLKVLILFCQIGMPGSACSPHNALAVYHARDANTQEQCMAQAAYAAANAANPPDPKIGYLKFVCARPNDIAQSTSRDETPLAH